jgi:prophage DNA circulation protein
MANIQELKSGIAWRQKWKPAMFRNARFHVDAGVRESGRRIVTHEFPKRDTPYAEDMGRRAREITVRGYIIVFPREGEGALQKKDYLPARDALITALEEEGPAVLQLPLLGMLNVAVTRYRVTEENKAGGFCTFDMSFVEYGQAPAEGTRQSKPGVYYAADELGAVIQSRVETGIKKIDEGAVIT